MLILMISTIGFLIGVRMIQNLSQSFSFLEKYKSKLIIFELMIVLLLMFFLYEMPEKFWFSAFIMLLFNFLTPKILIYYFKMKFDSKLLEILDQIVLEMQSGKNFRFAFQTLIQNETNFIKVQLSEIQNHLLFPERSTKNYEKGLARVICEFKMIDQAQAKSLDLVKFFRKTLKQEKEFAAKTKQMKEAVLIQALVLSILYFALLIYVLSQNEWVNIQKIIVTSGLFFILGQFLIFKIGRKKKWKV